jgi:HD-GYP domain-containing protein (c-di-GMP phosphodiesterase class II)
MPELSILVVKDAASSVQHLESLLIGIDPQIHLQSTSIADLPVKINSNPPDLLILCSDGPDFSVGAAVLPDLPVLCLSAGTVSGLPAHAVCVNPSEQNLRAVLQLAVQNARLQRSLRDRPALTSTSLETMRRHRQEAESLREVAATLNHTIDLTQVLNRILQHLKKVIPYDSCSIMLWSEDQLTIFASQGLQTQEQVEINITNASHIEQVLKSRAPLIIPDTRKDERWIIVKDDYIRCWLGVPLVVDGRAIGLLSIDKKEPSYYSAQDSELAMAFASQAAVALENARLHERTQRSLQRLSALRKIDMAISASLDLNFTLDILLNQVITQLGVDAADVLLFNPRTLTLDYAAGHGFRTNALQYSHVRLGDGYAGLSALQRQIINVVDLELTNTPFPHTLLTSSEGFHTYYAAPLIAKGQIKGVLEIFHRGIVRHEKDWLDFLEALGLQAAIAIDNVGMFEELQKSNLELTLSYESTLKGWAQAMELRDRETQGHTQRVTEMTELLSRRMGIEGEELAHIRRGAMLHDIGKMGIPDSILLKPGSLTSDEWEIMREHPVYAYEWLSGIPYLKESLAIPYCHHEKWEGGGYPRGLKGEEIPISARIFAVIDVWDALTSDRPYRLAWPREKALNYIREQADKQFDPRVVQAFLEILHESEWLNGGEPISELKAPEQRYISG